MLPAGLGNSPRTVRPGAIRPAMQQSEEEWGEGLESGSWARRPLPVQKEELGRECPKAEAESVEQRKPSLETVRGNHSQDRATSWRREVRTAMETAGQHL